MPDNQEVRRRRGGARRTRASAGAGALLECEVGEPRPLPAACEPSLLRPQQYRNTVWRWHIRRRRQTAQS